MVEWCTLQMDEGTTSQGMRAASKIWKREGSNSSLEPPEGTLLISTPEDPPWTCDLQKYMIIKMCCFKPVVVSGNLLQQQQQETKARAYHLSVSRSHISTSSFSSSEKCPGWDPDAAKDWGQGEKGATEDDMDMTQWLNSSNLSPIFYRGHFNINCIGNICNSQKSL